MVKILNSEEYREYYSLKIKDIVHTPFQTYHWIDIHEKYFGDRFYFIYSEKDGNFQVGLVLFETDTPYGKLYYSFGRFGTAGLILNPHYLNNVVEILVSFKEKILRDIEPNPLCISIGNLQIAYQSEKEIEQFKSFCKENDGIYFDRINHIANIDAITDIDKRLNLKVLSYQKRRHLLRNVKKAEENRLTISDKIDENIVRDWHKIHYKRVEELKGRIWRLEFFLQALLTKDSNYYKFFGIYKDGKLVGGSFCFLNRHILDLFMMSTLRDYQKIGANYLLSENIYLWCAQNDIKFINWQGSNPPEGGLAKFKEQWMAKRHIMHSVNIVCNRVGFQKIDKVKLMQEFPDRFFYPFG